jgi:O-methyltransferase
MIVGPDDSGGVLDESTFSLCHIDVDVYDSAKGVFDWVWPKLSVGGSVVFDDYGFFWCDGVTKLGNELSSIAGGSFIHNLNGHAIITKYR